MAKAEQAQPIEVSEVTVDLIKLEDFVKELEELGERTAGMFAHYFGSVKVVAEATHEEFTAMFEQFKVATVADLYPDIRNIQF